MAARDDHASFLGIGWAFGVSADQGGRTAMAIAEEDVRQALIIILGTAHGERVMRPDFGADLRSLVFEPISATTKAMVQRTVYDALIAWEPRIDVQDVRVTNEASMRQRLLIEIDYRVRETNTFYNLVYPFYLMEGEPR